jgi:hypothetical protein
VAGFALDVFSDHPCNFSRVSVERQTAVITKNREEEEGPQLEEGYDKHLLIHILFSLYCLKVKTFINIFISKHFKLSFVVYSCYSLLP